MTVLAEISAVLLALWIAANVTAFAWLRWIAGRER
jgi:hypothetical protein